MRCLLRLLSVVFITGLPAAQAAGLPAEVLRTLHQVHLPASALHVWVGSVDGRQPWLVNQAQTAVAPASVMKLVTTAAALDILGPAYTWQTEVWASAPPADGVVHGDLILKGQGDPTLTVERFWLLLSRLRAAGVREIDGDVLLDDHYFAANETSPQDFDGRPNEPYNALPDALLVNYKVTRLQLGNDQQGHLRIQAEPDTGLIIDPHLTVNPRLACLGAADAMHVDIDESGPHTRIRLTGSYAPHCLPYNLNIGRTDNRRYIDELFRTLWQQLGGTLTGQVRVGETPANAVKLLSFASQPLTEVLRDMDKFSNNLIARQIFLTLGAQAGTPATLAAARTRVAAWLKERGLDFPELVMDNGSGLSRQGRISAAHLAQLLQQEWARPVMPEFTAALPIVGVDGTLRRRFLHASLAGFAHMKSGSLEDVRAVAGYVMDRQGHRQVVVIVVDAANAPRAWPVIEKILDRVQNGPTAGHG